jgi:hypothetical protein
MLGYSAPDLDLAIARCLNQLKPRNILEYGCGQGKLGKICKLLELAPENLRAVQKLFNANDRTLLHDIGYTDIVDEDIYEYVRKGLKTKYDMIIALDVIEHFMYSDAISIIDSSLYNCEWLLLVWPSRLPQDGDDLDIHRTSFELRELASRFDIVYYSQTGLNEISVAQRYHLALVRGYMNFKTIRPALA